jgi:hypothetical protein
MGCKFKYESIKFVNYQTKDSVYVRIISKIKSHMDLRKQLGKMSPSILELALGWPSEKESRSTLIPKSMYNHYNQDYMCH